MNYLSVIFSFIIVQAVEAKLPNIVFILADDLGYGELGCYGQEKIITPVIDQLAAEGMKFTQHYTGAPVCAPARCVLMTGKHLAHAEIRGNRDSGNGKTFPGQWPITADALTIAEVLKKAGYTTGAFGKWGLGPSGSSGDPNKQGFDNYYGFNCQRNAHSFYPPFLDCDGKELSVNKNPILGHIKKLKGEVNAADYRDENYAPDLILAECLKFIDSNKDKPFFLYLPFVEPHVSMHPPQVWVDKYPKEWDKEPYRGNRGYIPHPRPRAGYAAMISDLDEHIGKVLDRLNKHEIADNTLVIFTSDNGPTHDVGGVDTQFFNSTGGLRGRKGSCYEGGIRVPTIVRWHGMIKPGSSTNAASYFPDWFPTLAAVGRATLDDAPNGNLDGVSLLPVLMGGKIPKRHEPMIWEFSGYGGIVAIRDGKWKALRRGLKREKGPSPWELYDLETDRNEQNDLAKKNPKIVKQLEKRWLQTRVGEPHFALPLIENHRGK
ncbi:MAG: arylsulfatase [Akkermansiaceae bacterium]|jgi:arylsulfatase A|nr:arylsulfatase [Akkermansiaceae bacterium]